MKKLFFALTLSVLFQSALAFNYSAYNVTWTDADGVTHIDPVTKKATDPRHIIALVQELFCNPVFPGNMNVDGKEGTDDVTYPTKYWGRTVTKPTNEGFTCILVELTDVKSTMYNSSTAQPTPATIAKCAKSVQLVSNVGENDNAYICSINGSFDRFYFAAKGKARNVSPAGWERLSATGNTQTKPSTDFYEKMISGDYYKVAHDCGDIDNLQHFYRVNADNNAPFMENLTIMVPKNRMTYWDKSTSGGFVWPNSTANYRDANGTFTWYNPDYCPRIALYQAHLSGALKRAADYETSKNYTVTLNWTSNLKPDEGLAWPGGETYEVYVMDENGNETLLTTQTDNCTYSYDVPEGADPYVLRYKVVCYPTNAEGVKVGPAVTNIVEFKIPFIVECQYRSRFEVSAMKNAYKNSIVMAPTNFEKATSSQATVYRASASAPDTKVKIATITFDKDNDTYSVAYEGALDANTQYRYDNTALSTSGKFSDGIKLEDYFFGDTQNGGDKAGGYEYYLQDEITSQYVTRAPVYTAQITSAYNTSEYHISDVMDDKDAHLALTNKAEVAFTNKSANTYNEIQSYDIYKNNAMTYRGTEKVEDGINAVANTYVGEIMANNGYATNTYGTNKAPLEFPLQSVLLYKKSNYNFTHTDTKTNVKTDMANYSATLKITPALGENVPYVYYYRIWRVDGNKKTELNSLDELKDEKSASPQWATTYGLVKKFFPLGETSNKDKQILVCDIFTATRSGATKSVTYIVRMYATTNYKDLSGQSAPAKSDIKATEDVFNPECQIVESSCTVTFDNNTPTDVVDFTTSKTVSSVRYYNLLGVASSTPFNGINIVVTTYTDGSRTSTKQIK